MMALYEDNGVDNELENETAFCSLAALVPDNISDSEYEDVAYNVVKAVSTLIEKCPKISKNHERTMLARKSLGIGVTGLAELLYSNGLDYDGSEESLEFVHDFFEKHYYSLLKASVRLAKETGESVGGITDWLPIDSKRSKFTNKQDWEALRGLPRHNSVLVCVQPTESSSLASGKSNSVYPPRSKVVNKRSRKGVVQFICKPFKEGETLTAWSVGGVTLSRYYGVIQDFCDQGLSADTYFDPSNYSDGKKPLSELIREWVAHFRLGNKSLYYVNTRDVGMGNVHDILKDTTEIEEDGCTSCTL